MRAGAGGWRCGVRNSKRRGVLEEPGSRAVGAGSPPARLPERPHPPSAYRGETGGLPGARRALCPPAPPRCPWAAPGRRSGGNANIGSLPPALSHPLAAPHTHLGARPRQLPPRAGPGRAGPHRRAAAAGAGAAVPDSPPAHSAVGPLRPPRPSTARPPGLGQQRRGGPAAGPGAAGPLPGPRRCAPSWPCPDTAVSGCAAPAAPRSGWYFWRFQPPGQVRGSIRSQGHSRDGERLGAKVGWVPRSWRGGVWAGCTHS